MKNETTSWINPSAMSWSTWPTLPDWSSMNTRSTFTSHPGGGGGKGGREGGREGGGREGGREGGKEEFLC